MATTNRIAPTVTNDEIRARIADLEESTEDDDMFDEWSNVAMLDAELERRGEPRGGFWGEEPEIEDLADTLENLDVPWMPTFADMYPAEAEDLTGPWH